MMTAEEKVVFQRVATPDDLLNSTELAARLGVSVWVVQGLKMAAPELFTGRYTTERKVRAWMDAHPEFVASHYRRRAKAARVLTPAAERTAAR